jgi:hypothetical protein
MNQEERIKLKKALGYTENPQYAIQQERLFEQIHNHTYKRYKKVQL